MVKQKDVGKKRKGKQKRKHFAKELTKTNNQPVILSEEKRSAFFVVEVLPSEE